MCKYCEFTYEDEIEKENGCVGIIKIEEGHITTEVSLYRYQAVGGESEGVLVLDSYITQSLVQIETRDIPIKYCPFCGEKL